MQLYSRVIGSGTPLVILHGLFGMSDNWLSIAKELAPHGFAVHLLDLRNHGRSPHGTPHSYHTMSEDLLEYLDKIETSQVMIAGHSMGGKLAMYFTLLYPDRVSRLAVIDIAPANYSGHDPGFHLNIIHQLSTIDLKRHTKRSTLTEEIQQRLHDKRLSMFLGKSVGRDGDGNFYWKLNLPVLRDSLAEIYGGFEDLDERAPGEVATVFIRGEKSDYLQARYEPDRVRFFPEADVVTIPGAGHWLHIEQPERLLGSLLTFFKT